MPRLTFTTRVSRLVYLHPKSCPSGPVQRGRDAGAIPIGGRLGKGARDATALVCGVPRGCFPLGRIPQGGTPLRRGFRGENPCRAVAARSEAGILRDGFGVPLARNIACDVYVTTSTTTSTSFVLRTSESIGSSTSRPSTAPPMNVNGISSGCRRLATVRISSIGVGMVQAIF